MTNEIDERTRLEGLDRAESLSLLARNSLGRLAVIGGSGRPLVFPVNFALANGAIVLRTDHGTKLYFARDQWVAFECDGIDRTYHSGGTVLAPGSAEEMENPAEIAELERVPLGVWGPGPK